MKDDAVEGDDVEVIDPQQRRPSLCAESTAKKASGKRRPPRKQRRKSCEKENPGLIALFLDQHLIFTGIIGCSIWAGRN